MNDDDTPLIEHDPFPDYFRREKMIAEHGEGWRGMVSYIGWTGFIGGLVAGLINLFH